MECRSDGFVQFLDTKIREQVLLSSVLMMARCFPSLAVIREDSGLWPTKMQVFIVPLATSPVWLKPRGVIFAAMILVGLLI
jgi:hypothetical protein